MTDATPDPAPGGVGPAGAVPPTVTVVATSPWAWQCSTSQELP